MSLPFDGCEVTQKNEALLHLTFERDAYVGQVGRYLRKVVYAGQEKPTLLDQTKDNSAGNKLSMIRPGWTAIKRGPTYFGLVLTLQCRTAGQNLYSKNVTFKTSLTEVLSHTPVLKH